MLGVVVPRAAAIPWAGGHSMGIEGSIDSSSSPTPRPTRPSAWPHQHILIRTHTPTHAHNARAIIAMHMLYLFPHYLPLAHGVRLLCTHVAITACCAHALHTRAISVVANEHTSSRLTSISFVHMHCITHPHQSLHLGSIPPASSATRFVPYHTYQLPSTELATLHGKSLPSRDESTP